MLSGNPDDCDGHHLRWRGCLSPEETVDIETTLPRSAIWPIE
jgi:hypothetical protein